MTLQSNVTRPQRSTILESYSGTREERIIQNYGLDVQLHGPYGPFLTSASDLIERTI